MGISGKRLEKLKKLIDSGTPEKFYSWKSWGKIRQEVLKLDKYECQNCKRHGKYRKGYIVHHVKHLRDRPELAMSIYDPETGERQLETVCKECHEAEHPESFKQYCPTEDTMITLERWD